MKEGKKEDKDLVNLFSILCITFFFILLPDHLNEDDARSW